MTIRLDENIYYVKCKKYFKNIDYGFLNEKHLTLYDTIIQVSESKKFILTPHLITFIARKSYIKPKSSLAVLT